MMTYSKDNSNAQSGEKLLNLNEIAMIVGVSVQTINSWYKWKRLHPEHELTKLIPDFVRIGNKNTRYWKQSDAWMLMEFHSAIPQGRNGIMGDVTQQYYRKTRRKKKGSEI